MTTTIESSSSPISLDLPPLALLDLVQPMLTNEKSLANFNGIRSIFERSQKQCHHPKGDCIALKRVWENHHLQNLITQVTCDAISKADVKTQKCWKTFLNKAQTLKAHTLDPYSRTINLTRNIAYLQDIHQLERDKQNCVIEHLTMKTLSRRDKRQICDILQESFEWESDGEFQHWMHHPRTVFCDVIVSRDKSTGQILGYLIHGIENGAVYFSSIARRANTAKLGVAHQLMNAFFKNHVNGNTKILLHVAESNPARELYEAYGFEIIGKKPHYYRIGDETGYYMMCNLAKPETRALINKQVN